MKKIVLLVLFFFCVQPIKAMNFQKKFEQALGSNDLFKAKIFYALGASVDVVDKNNTTLFHKVAKCANVATMRWCLEKVSDVDREDNEGCTALHYTACYCRPEVIRMLMLHENGKAIPKPIKQIQSPLLFTLLHTMKRNGQLTKTVKALLECGAHPNAFCSDYIGSFKTPLTLAIGMRYTSIIRLLVTYGALKYATIHEIDIAMSRHSGIEKEACLHALLSCWNDDSICNKECLLFNKDPSILSFVRAYDGNIARCIDGQTVLHEAVRFRVAECEVDEVDRIPSLSYYLRNLFEPSYSKTFCDEAQRRIKTFLLCNKRLSEFQRLPKDLISQILTHIPAFIYNAKLLTLCLPIVRDGHALTFAQQCSTNLLRQVAQNIKGDKASQILDLQDEYARYLCSIQNEEGKTAYELAVQHDDGLVASLVDPSTTKVIR